LEGNRLKTRPEWPLGNDQPLSAETITVAGIAMYGRGRITIIFNKRVRKLIRIIEQEALIAFF
jgi:hypothetical protein